MVPGKGHPDVRRDILTGAKCCGSCLRKPSLAESRANPKCFFSFLRVSLFRCVFLLSLILLIPGSPTDCTAGYLPPSNLPGGGGGEGSDCTGEWARLPSAFPTGAPSSGEQLTAALIITRLTPPLHNFNTSFYAGIWGCVCL